MSEAAPAAASAPAETTPAPAATSTPAPASAAQGTAPASPAPEGTTMGSPTGTAAPSGSSGTDTQDWSASLVDDNRQLVQKKGWKDLNSALASYRELESTLGKKIEPPPPTADKAERDAFYAKLGRPQTAEEYKLGLPEGIPENAPYDGTFATAFKTWAHEAGLNPEQAKVLHDNYVKHTMGSFQQVAEAMTQRVGAAHAAITKEWGDPESEGYKRHVEFARRATRQLELEGAFKEAGLLDAYGQVTDAKVAFALSRVGAKMFSEDSMYSGPAGVQDNPFSERTFNMTRQALMIKNDPAKAEVLIRAAGKNPADFGITSG